jgi:hypothetical protein
MEEGVRAADATVVRVRRVNPEGCVTRITETEEFVGRVLV